MPAATNRRRRLNISRGDFGIAPASFLSRGSTTSVSETCSLSPNVTRPPPPPAAASARRRLRSGDVRCSSDAAITPVKSATDTNSPPTASQRPGVISVGNVDEPPNDEGADDLQQDGA